MTIRHIVDDCFVESIGEGGLPGDEYDQLLARTTSSLERLKSGADRNAAAILALAGRTDDLAELSSRAAEWRRRFKRVFLLGTGGSALGARALASALPRAADAPELVVLDNLDGGAVAPLTDPQTLSESAILVISKSGDTDEALSQALVAAATLREAFEATATAERFLMIADPGDRPLRRLAAALGAPVLDHDPDIGGRFSVLSLVGLLPAMMLGLDASDVRAGAQIAVQANLRADTPAAAPAAQGAAISVGLNASRGISQTVMLAYDQRLQTFTKWHRQLWAESLGKRGRGMTPIDALGPVDQHSQLQLYLDGPWDKMFTVLTLPQRGLGPVIDAELARAVGMEAIAGRRLGDLVAAMQRATAGTLAKRGRPVRTLALQRLDGETMGALFMHFMLETLIAADLLDVNPFGQPAVDEGKNLARRYLTEAGRGNGAGAEEGDDR